jgi:ABC-2 type transport system permease protein
MNREFNAFTGMVYMQLKRWVSSRSRVVPVILQPFLRLFFIGLGSGIIFSGNINTPFDNLPIPVNTTLIIQLYFNKSFGGVDYITFLVSGLVVITALIGGSHRE